jgi:hypothetical protein
MNENVRGEGLLYRFRLGQGLIKIILNHMFKFEFKHVIINI